MALIEDISLPNSSTYPVAFFRGTCATAAGTTAKAVTCTSFASTDLKKGALILVTFDNTNSGAVGSLTLNVNSTGAKPIKKQYNTGISNLTSAGEIIANQTYFFQYDGTNWVCMNVDYNTEGAAAKCYISYGTDTSAADKIKEAYDASIDIFLNPMNVTSENVAVEVPLTSYKYVESTGIVTAQFAQPINSSIYEFDVIGTVGSNNSSWSNTSKRIEGTPYQSITASSTTISIYPNIETNFSNALTGSRTFLLVQPTDQTISNFYFWSFTAASSVTITWPSGIKWANNSIPEYDSSYVTEVLISQNRGTWLKYPV